MEKYTYYYFLGIGGIGMSALSRFIQQQGNTIFGYDKTSTPLTTQLLQEGIHIGFKDCIEHIPEEIINNKNKSLIIYTTALHKNNQIINYLRKNGYIICKRSEALGKFTQFYPTIAVAGTHGKTTTSAMIAHLLYVAQKNMIALIGGIMQNYRSNFLMQGKLVPNTIFVVEADEFDRSFLYLHPNWAIVTTVDADHLDIYESTDAIETAFKNFIQLVPPNGYKCLQQKVTQQLKINNKSTNIQQYALKNSKIYAQNILNTNGNFQFDYISSKHIIKNIILSTPGHYNVENALAAITLCLKLGIETSVIKKGFASFKGIQRRFEYIIQKKNLIFIDDYAHTPTEITALLQAIKKLYPAKKVTSIFQPHLYSRTKDFSKAFGQSLSLADEVFLLPIYPAREPPIPGITAQYIFDHIFITKKFLCQKENLFDLLKKNSKFEVIVTIGAGDISQLIESLKNFFISY